MITGILLKRENRLGESSRDLPFYLHGEIEIIEELIGMIHKQIDQRFGEILLADLLRRRIETFEQLRRSFRLLLHQRFAVGSHGVDRIVEFQILDVIQGRLMLFQIFNLNFDEFVVTSIFGRELQRLFAVTGLSTDVDGDVHVKA